MRLYLIRHAEAIPSQGASVLDEERWLTDVGRARFRKVAKSFRKVVGEEPRLFTSPLVRCVQTAELFREVLRSDEVVTVWPGLKPGISARAVLLRVDALDRKRPVAVCGHEPQMSGIAATLLGLRELPLPFPKGAIAAFELRHARTGRRADFRWVLVPKGRRFLALDGNDVARPS